MRRWHDLIDGASGGARRGVLLAALVVLVVAGVTAAGLGWLRGPKPPPSIFDAPATDVAGFLASRDFSALPIEERLAFISGLMERFRGLSQSDSAVVAAFFAGLTGPAREVLRDNIRVLGKDILVQGAAGYLALKSPEQRGAYLDQWLIKWARFGQEIGVGGLGSARTEQEILDRLRRDARRDADRGLDLNASMAQQILDFWQSDIASVTTPVEQGQVFTFLPAVRDHLLKPAK